MTGSDSAMDIDKDKEQTGVEMGWERVETEITVHSGRQEQLQQETAPQRLTKTALPPFTNVTLLTEATRKAIKMEPSLAVIALLDTIAEEDEHDDEIVDEIVRSLSMDTTVLRSKRVKLEFRA